MKVTLQIEIDCKKALPEELCDIAAHRIYAYLYAHGCEAGVRVMLQATEDHSATELERLLASVKEAQREPVREVAA